uniref:Uncharacterized protein n=1 Tax=Salix viminalis TaxID=40686 RepID=A0A6N2LS00_SALVM
MAFCKRLGSLVRQSISQSGQVSMASMLNSFRCITSKNLFVRYAFLFCLKQKKESLSNKRKLRMMSEVKADGGGAEGSNDGDDNRDTDVTAVNAFITRVVLLVALQVEAAE